MAGYYGLVGRLDWVSEQPATVQERMHTFDPAAQRICLLQIVLQIYTITTALYTRHPLLMTPVAFTHHVMTGVSMCVVARPFGHSRIGIFFGATAWSKQKHFQASDHLHLLRILRLVAPGGSTLPGGKPGSLGHWATGRLATAACARASHLRSRRCH